MIFSNPVRLSSYKLSKDVTGTRAAVFIDC